MNIHCSIGGRVRVIFFLGSFGVGEGFGLGPMPNMICVLVLHIILSGCLYGALEL